MAFDRKLAEQITVDLKQDRQSEVISKKPPIKKDISEIRAAANEYLKEIGKYRGTPAQIWARKKIAQAGPVSPRESVPITGGLKAVGKSFQALASGFVYGLGESLSKYFGDVATNLAEGVYGAELTTAIFGGIGKKEAQRAVETPTPDIYRRATRGLAEEFYRGAEFWKSKAKEPKGIIEKFYFALGNLPPVLAKYAIASRLFHSPVAGFAIERYLQTKDPMEALRAAALGFVLEGTAGMPYILKTPAVASYAMVDAAVSGAEPEDILVSGAVMGILASTGKAPCWREWRNMGKMNAKVADIRDLEPEARRDAVNDITNLLKKRQLQIKNDPHLADQILKQHRKLEIEVDKRERPWKYKEAEVTLEPPKRPGIELPKFPERQAKLISKPEISKEEFLGKTEEEIKALRSFPRKPSELVATKEELAALKRKGVHEDVLATIARERPEELRRAKFTQKQIKTLRKEPKLPYGLEPEEIPEAVIRQKTKTLQLGEVTRLRKLAKEKAFDKQYQETVVVSQKVKAEVESRTPKKAETPEPLLSPKEEAKLQREIELAKKKIAAKSDEVARKELEEHESKLMERERAEELEEQAYDRLGISRYNRDGIAREFEEDIKSVYEDTDYEIKSRAEERRGVKAEKFDNIKTEDTDVILSFLGLFGRSNNVLRDIYDSYRKFEKWVGRTRVGKYFVEHPGLTPEEVAIIEKRRAAESVHVLEPAKVLQEVLTKKQQGGFLKRAKKFSKDERMIIGKLLRSNLTDREVDADLQLKEAARVARDEIDFMGELLIDVLEKQSRPPEKLIETIRKNQGTYMRREFLRNIDPDFRPTETVIEDAINWFQDNFTRGRGKNKRPVTREEAERIVDHLLAKGKPRTFKREGFTGPRLRKRWIAKRKPMNETLDALFGLVEDPVYPVVSGQLKTARFVEDSLFFEELAKNPKVTSDTRKEGFALMEGSQWGRLDGKYVREPVKFELEGAFREPSGLEKFMGKFLSRWKIVKVSSPKTWGRNIITNTIMFNLSGCMLAEIPAYLTRAAHQMATKGIYWRQMKQRGGIDRTLGRQELEEFMAEFKKPGARMGLWGFVDKVMFLRRFSGAYGAQENIYKLAKFIEVMRKPDRYKEDFKRYQKDRPGSDMADFANSEAQKWFFDYSVTARFTKYMKRTFVPFITWQMKVAPRLVEAATKRPVTFWKYPALAAFAYLKAKQRMDLLTDEDWQKVKKLYPSYLRRGQVLVLPWKDKNGNFRMTDLTFVMPGGFWLELIGGTYGAAKDQETFEAMRAWSKAIGNPLLSGWLAFTTGRDQYTGREIFSEKSLERDKWVEFMKYLSQLAFFAWIPGGYDFGKVRALARGEKDWASKTTKDIQWELPGFLGLLTLPMDTKKFYTQARIRLDNKKEEIDKEKRIAQRALMNRKITPAAYKRRIAYLKKERARLIEERKAISEAKRIVEEKGLWNEPKE